MNSKGEKYKVPVGARDLMIIAGISQDKLNVSLGKPTTISSTQSTTRDKLKELKKAALEVSADNNVVGIED